MNWAALVVPLALGVLTLFARRSMPGPDGHEIPISPRNRRFYAALDAFFVVPFLVFTFAVSIVCCLVISGVLTFRDETGPRFTLRPHKYFWLIPSLFCGIPLGAFFSVASYRVLLKDRFADYIARSDRQNGYETMRAANFLCGLSFLIAVGLMYCGVSYSTKFYEKTILCVRPFRLTRAELRYEDVLSLQKIPRMKSPLHQGDREFTTTITFRDGTTLSTGEGLSDNEEAFENELYDFLCRKTRGAAPVVDTVGAGPRQDD